METCPVCDDEYEKSHIEAHVNSHFDEAEPVKKKVKREESFQISSSPPSSSSFSSLSSILKSNDKHIKCHNCGESVPSWDWNRHCSVHDDEAIALALAETPEKRRIDRSSSNDFFKPYNLDDKEYHKNANKDNHKTNYVTNNSTTNTTTHSSINNTLNDKPNNTTSDNNKSKTNSILDVDAETQQELEKFIKDNIRDEMIDITGHLRKIYAKCRSSTLQHAVFCGPVDHYASQRDDMGWGCGYRNIQNVCSFMMRYSFYKEILFNGCGYVPSIQALQMYLEEAWKQGYDVIGKQQLGRVAGTGKFIGTTECATLLRSYGVRCEIVDFHCNCCTEKKYTPNYTPFSLNKDTDHIHKHTALVEWVYNYYNGNSSSHVSVNTNKNNTTVHNGNIFAKQSNEKDKQEKEHPHGPLYFQHHGHSRTIIGAEKHKTGKYYLLVLDPSIRERSLAHALAEQNLTALKILRLPQEYFRHKRYQIARVSGVMTESEKIKSKTVSSLSVIVSPP